MGQTAPAPDRVNVCCRNDGGQWHEEEGEQTASESQGENDAAVDDDTDDQLPVNTLFYGVRGQQVCSDIGIRDHNMPHGGFRPLVFLFLFSKDCHALMVGTEQASYVLLNQALVPDIVIVPCVASPHEYGRCCSIMTSPACRAVLHTSGHYLQSVSIP